MLAATGARALDDELPVGQAHDAFGAGGALVDPRLRELPADAARPAGVSEATPA